MIRKLTNTYKQSFSGLSRETWVLSTVLLINRSSSMAVPFMSLYMTQYLNRPPSDAGLIISLFGVGSIAGAAAGGKLTDVIGFRSVQVISSIVGGIFFILFSTITDFHSLCIFTLLISFFSEAFKPANFIAIGTYAAPGTETRSYSLNRLAGNLGFAVGSSVGGIVASFSYPMLFIIDGSVSVVAGILILYFLPATKIIVKTVTEKIKETGALKPWQDKLFVRFILLNILLNTCFFLMFRLVPLFYKEVWHINELWIGLILGLNGLIIALFEMVMISKIENRRSLFHYIIWGILLLAVGYILLLMPWIGTVVAALISIIIFTAGEMFALPFINSFVMSRSNDTHRGLYAASYTLSWSVAQVIGPSAGFYLAERYGYNWLWIILVLLLLWCAAGFRFLGRIVE